MPDFAEISDDILVRHLAYFNYRGYVDRMLLRGDEKVLEVGSGGGNLSRFLAERLSQGRLVCIDHSEYWIGKAKRRLRKARNIEFRLEDVLDFNEENYFDVGIVHYVLHDIAGDERVKVVDILSRSLNEKGIIHIREPTRENHGMPSGEIRDLMNSNGFIENCSAEGYSFPLRGRIYEGVFQKSTSCNYASIALLF